MLMCGLCVLLNEKKKSFKPSQQGPLTIMLMHHLCADAKWWCSNSSGFHFVHIESLEHSYSLISTVDS